MTRLPRPLIRLLIAVKRAVRRVLRGALVRYARAAPDPSRDPQDKVYILLVSAWGMGGTIRAAINLASYLADRHEVEIISTYRRNEQPYFAFDERVKVTALDDQRAGATPRHLRPLRNLLRRVPSAIYHPADIRKPQPQPVDRRAARAAPARRARDRDRQPARPQHPAGRPRRARA